MTFETEPSRPPESLPLPSQEAVFPEDSTLSDALPLPDDSAAERDGQAHSQSGQAAEGSSDPSSATSSLRASVPPSLSPSDLSLLTSYTELHFNPTAVAKHHKLHLLEVLTWLNAPHIRPHLREIRKAFALSFKLRAEESRQIVIDALEDVITTTEDLVEKRRAATTLLRALSLPRRRRTTLHSTGTPPNPSPSSSSSTSSSSSPSDSKSAAIQELLSILDQNGTINRDRLIDLADKIDLENEQALDTESDEDDDESDNNQTQDPQGSQDLQDSASKPEPTEPCDPSLHPQWATLQGPKLDYSPAQVVEKIMRGFHEDHPGFSPGGAATCRNFLSKSSPFFRPTFNAFRHAFQDFTIIDLQASKTYELGPTTIDGNTATSTVKTTAKDVGPNQTFLFTLTKAGPEEPWLLHDVKPNNTFTVRIPPNPYKPNNTS